jgi:hypothetical protein
MSVATLLTGESWASSGTLAPRTIPFPFIALDDVVFTYTDEDGAVDALVRGTDYTITGDNRAGTAVFTPLVVFAAGGMFRSQRQTRALQEYETERSTPLNAESVERELDRQAMRNLEQDRDTNALSLRTPKVPVGEAAPQFDSLIGLQDGDLLFYEDGKIKRFDVLPFAGKFVYGGAGGRLVPSTGTGGGDTALRGDLATSGAPLIGFSDPRAAAILTPLDKVIEQGNLARFLGGVLSNGTDETLKLRAALEIISQDTDYKGVPLSLKPGALTVVSSEIVIPVGVHLSLNGGILEGQLAGGNDALIRILSDTGVSNGTLRVVSTGSPGSQATIHCPVFAGERYGAKNEDDEYFSPTNRSPYDVVRHFLLWNLRVTSNKDLGTGATAGAAGIAITGDVAEGLIGFCRVLASSKMSVGIGADWGEVGGNVANTRQGIISAQNQMQNNLDLYQAGRAMTTHPHDVTIWNSVVEALTRPYQGSSDTGSAGIRLSGCYGIRVLNSVVHHTTEAGFQDHAGDVGYEFASDADFRGSLRGNVWENVSLLEASTGDGFRPDDNADNVGRALTTSQLDFDGSDRGAVYTPQRSSIFPSATIVSNLLVRSTAGASAGFGINSIKKVYGSYLDPVISGFKIGARFSGGFGQKLIRSRITFSRQQNILVEDGADGIEILDTMELAYANRGGGGHFGVHVRQSSGTKIIGGVFGANTADETAVQQIACVGLEAQAVEIDNITINSHAAGGYGLAAGSGEQFDVLWHVGRVKFGDYVTQPYVGQSLIPERKITAAGQIRTIWRGPSTATLTGLAGRQGDIVEYDNFTANGRKGFGWTVEGTHGTLTGITGSIASGSKSLTLNSVTGVQLNQIITIAGVSGNKKIVALNRATNGAKIDSAADATVSGAAVAFAAPTTKTWGAIDV